MPNLHMLIGPPGSGKSTWRSAYLANVARPVVIVSSDDLIEVYRSEHGLTYSEAMRQVVRRDIERTVRDDFIAAVGRGDDVIVDRTNMSVKARRKFLHRVPPTYTKIAVVFSVPDAVLWQRLAVRETTGKYVPHDVVRNMIASFEEPDNNEFDRIEKVQF